MPEETVELDHRYLLPYQIHPPWSFIFNNTLERESVDVYAEDVFKLALQTDDMSLWMLATTDPGWVRISTPAVPTTPGGIAGGHLKGFYPNPQVVDDSHRHEPGISIPSYPSSLPPSGPAGGDLVGSFPNPFLRPSGVIAGSYTNPTLAVDSRGIILNISSHPLGEANYGVNLGLGTPLYAGKMDEALQFNSMRAAFNSGLSLSLSGGEIHISSPGLALLSGATFTGPVTTPSLDTTSLLSNSQRTPLYDAGGGSNWIPSSLHGSYQSRSVFSSGTLSPFSDNPSPGFLFEFLLNVSPGVVLSLSSSYKIARGQSRSLGPGLHLLRGRVISSNVYATSMENYLE